MKTLLQCIQESSIERYQLKMTLKKFFEYFLEYYSGSKFGTSKNSAKEWIVDNLNKYSDGGPKKDDWFNNNQNKEMTFTTYQESEGSKNYHVIEIQDPDYDMMKMKLEDKQGLSANKHLYLVIKNKGKKI